MTTYACIRHPSVRVTLHVHGSAHCTRCGRPLRLIDGPVEAQPALFALPLKEAPRAP